MFIVITPDEFSLAIHVASSRQVAALKAQRREKRQGGKRDRDWVDGLSGHLKGVIGEMSVAKALGLTFSGSVDTFRECPDIPEGLEVKHRAAPGWELILRPSDNVDAVYVLSRGLPPAAVEVAGWVSGKEAMVPSNWAEKHGVRPAWWVPDSSLRPIETLKSNMWRPGE